MKLNYSGNDNETMTMFNNNETDDNDNDNDSNDKIIKMHLQNLRRKLSYDNIKASLFEI